MEEMQTVVLEENKLENETNGTNMKTSAFSAYQVFVVHNEAHYSATRYLYVSMWLKNVE